MVSYKIKLAAKTEFDGCTNFSMSAIGGFAKGFNVVKCDRCYRDTIAFSTGFVEFKEDGEKVDMKELCTSYLHLIEADIELFDKGEIVEDYSDDYEYCCSECRERTGEKGEGETEERWFLKSSKRR